ncbi:MAG: carbohydrate kinase family protein [Candidatus Parvarchaeota archaeon]|nr:carbohydrate kinase family protein [Candidatus Parvarchaeota archaeon]
MLEFDVVTVGSATKDIFLFSKQSNLKQGINSHFLEVPFDRKVEVNKVLEFTGGSATNAAATFANFGKKAGVIARLGNDSNSAFILEDLKSRGIADELVIKSDGETQFSVVIVSNIGKAVIFVYRGIEKNLRYEDIEREFKAGWIYLGPLPAEDTSIIERLIETHRSYGARFAMNPGSNFLNLGIKKTESILKNIDIISMNQEEARKFVGLNNDVKNLIELAKRVKSAAIITKGKEGSITADKKYIYYSTAKPAKQINYVGAGDAFFSAFVNAIIDEKSVEDAINLASYNSAGVVEKYGAKSGLVSRYPSEKVVKIKKMEYAK